MRRAVAHVLLAAAVLPASGCREAATIPLLAIFGSHYAESAGPPADSYDRFNADLDRQNSLAEREAIEKGR